MTGPAVLLVDDSATVRLILGALLEEHGFVIAEAATLAEAREQLAGSPFDVCILDVNLEEENGLDLVPELRERWPATKIMVSSGEEMRPEGVDGFALKGDDPDKMVADLRALLA